MCDYVSKDKDHHPCGCSNTSYHKIPLPQWLHRPLRSGGVDTKNHIRQCGLCTVCEESLCPNLSECYQEGRATFLLLGPTCTRSCGFCHVRHSPKPLQPDPNEPEKVAAYCTAFSLKHIVLTMVSRDDLSDGGASHVAATIRAIRSKLSSATVEVLTSDFGGSYLATQIVLNEQPEVFAHNIETVEALSDTIRSKATYRGSLSFLKSLQKDNPTQITKSGFMVGLGETAPEVIQTLKDLVEVGVSMVTIGQYLQPSHKQVSVKEWIHPDIFREYEEAGKTLGILEVIAGPTVRSSYRAHPLRKKSP